MTRSQRRRRRSARATRAGRAASAGELGRQTSQNSISTGWRACFSMRSGATFTQARSFGKVGAAIVSTGERIGAGR